MRTDCKRVALVRTQGWWRISNENLWPFAARAQYCTTRRVSVRTPTQQAEDVIPFSRRHKGGATTILFSPDRTATARARLTRGNGGHHFAAAVGVAALKSGVRPIISVVAAEPANAGALYRARRRK